MTKLDLTKPMQTRNGRPAKLLYLGLKASQSLVFIVQDLDGYERVQLNSEDGSYFADPDNPDSYDIINVSKEHTMWINIYSNPFSEAYPTREEADEEAESDRIACVKVTYTDGEGLE